MKNLYLKVSYLVVLIFALSESRSQEVFPVTGGDVSGSGGSISYTVGQVFYQFQTGTNGRLFEGVQHPYYY